VGNTPRARNAPKIADADGLVERRQKQQDEHQGDGVPALPDSNWLDESRHGRLHGGGYDADEADGQ
jgi:hypothetical protein